jgi:diketogulonate reductase-like aldo/keto reductase
MSFALPNGCMPAVGYGCWKVGKDTAADLIENVIRLGYRHIDGACDYANEKEVSKDKAKVYVDDVKYCRLVRASEEQ